MNTVTLDSVLLGAFLHDFAKPFARAYAFSKEALGIIRNLYPAGNDPSYNWGDFIDHRAAWRDAVQKIYPGRRNYYFYHSLLGVLILTSIWGGDLSVPFNITPTEEAWGKNHGFNPIILKAIIGLHHIRSEEVDQFLRALSNLGLLPHELRSAYKKIFTNYVIPVQKADHQSAKEGRTRTFTNKRTPNLHNIWHILNSSDRVFPIYPIDNNHEILERIITGLPADITQDTEAPKNLADKMIQDIQTALMAQQLEGEQLTSLLNVILKRYLSLTKADLREQAALVSLYEHLYSTALLTYSSLFDSKRFWIIIVDFGGVQRFIFDIRTTKAALKIIKSRSVLIQLELESIKQYLKEKLQLPLFAEIFNAGGKFALVIPSDLTTLQEVNNIKKHIKEQLFYKYEGEVEIRIGISETTAKEIRSAQVLDIIQEESHLTELDKEYSKAKQNLKWEKMHPYVEVLTQLQGRSFAFDITHHGELPSSQLCDICGKRVSKATKKLGEEEYMTCDICNNDLELAHNLRKTKGFAFYPQDTQSPSEGISLTFHHVVPLIKENGKTNLEDFNFANSYVLFTNLLLAQDLNTIHTLLHAKGFGFQPISTYMPRKSSFEDLVGDLSYLAVLKGDVDNLGDIFGTQITELYKTLIHDNGMTYATSFKRTASSLLQLFWEIYLPHFIKKNYKDSAYLVYVGGDDFLIIGPWERMIRLAQDIEKKWRLFTGGDKDASVTFSSSLILFKPNYPIWFVIQEADDKLTYAKSFEKLVLTKSKPKKNKVYLINGVVPKEVLLEIQYTPNQMANNVDPNTNDLKTFAAYLLKLAPYLTHGLIYKIQGLLKILQQALAAPEELAQTQEFVKAYLHYLKSRRVGLTKPTNSIKRKEASELFDNTIHALLGLITAPPSELTKNLETISSLLTYLIVSNRDNLLNKINNE